MPLLVLGIVPGRKDLKDLREAMGVAKQFTVGIVLCAAAFLWDYVAQQRARRSRANADLAKARVTRVASALLSLKECLSLYLRRLACARCLRCVVWQSCSRACFSARQARQLLKLQVSKDGLSEQ